MQVTSGVDGIYVQSTTAYMGADEACAFFSGVEPEPAGVPCSQRPADESFTTLSHTAVEFRDPPGVAGPIVLPSGISANNGSGGSLPVSGVLVYEPGVNGFLFTEVCAMPARRAHLCDVLLRDAVMRAPQ